jgi:hypothetical protein
MHPSILKERMLFCVFIAIQIIRYVTCDDYPMEEKLVDYFVTTNRIPDKLNNGTLKTIGDTCAIDIIWN